MGSCCAKDEPMTAPPQQQQQPSWQHSASYGVQQQQYIQQQHQQQQQFFAQQQAQPPQQPQQRYEALTNSTEAPLTNTMEAKFRDAFFGDEGCISHYEKGTFEDTLKELQPGSMKLSDDERTCLWSGAVDHYLRAYQSSAGDYRKFDEDDMAEMAKNMQNMLSKVGADINQKDENGWTEFCWKAFFAIKDDTRQDCNQRGGWYEHFGGGYCGTLDFLIKAGAEADKDKDCRSKVWKDFMKERQDLIDSGDWTSVSYTYRPLNRPQKKDKVIDMYSLANTLRGHWNFSNKDMDDTDFWKSEV